MGADISEIEEGSRDTIGTILDSDDVLEERMDALMRMSLEDTGGLDTAVMSEEQLLHLQKLVKDYYDLAADAETRNTQGMEPLRKHVEEIQNISSLQELTDYLTDIGKKNVAGISLLPLSVTRARNEEDAREYTVYITAKAPLTMGEWADGYKDISISQKEKSEDMVQYALAKLGFSDKEIRRILQGCYAFEINLSEHIPTLLEGESDREYTNVEKADQVYDLEQLEALAGHYPIAEFLKAAGYEESKTFTVEEPDQVKNVGRLYTDKNLENMKDYLLVQLVLLSADVLDEIYVGHYCTAQMKQDLLSLTNRMIEGFRDVLEQADWMAEETRQKAVEKLENIGMHVLYPDQMTDFSSLDFSDCSSMLEARGRLKAFRQQQMASFINKPMDQSTWDTTYLPTSTCNAFYVPGENTINICAGFIASEGVYDPEESLEYNLGRIGAVIGHEISHGFDTNGYIYDKDGLAVNWWTKEDQEQFEMRARKLEQYYDALSPVPQNAGTYKGELVAGEAIADMAGVKAALMAARKQDWLSDR